MKIWACSDHHFFHFNIIKYAERPFELSELGLKESTKLMIDNHNSVVKDEDIVFFVGDLSHGRNQSEEGMRYILEHMNGKKVLIKGNHDNFSNLFYDEVFDAIYDDYLFGGIYFCHYPCYESRWTTKQEESFIKKIKEIDVEYIIHGHIHNKDPELWESDGYKRINVCVDYKPNNFYPVEITKYFKNYK